MSGEEKIATKCAVQLHAQVVPVSETFHTYLQMCWCHLCSALLHTQCLCTPVSSRTSEPKQQTHKYRLRRIEKLGN